MAYIKLKKYKEAQQVLNEFPDDRKTRRYFSLLVKLMSRTKNLAEVDEAISQSDDLLAKETKAFMFYIAARELSIANELEHSEHYAQKIVDLQTDDNYLLGWAYYFLEDMEKAQQHFKNELQLYPDDKAVTSQIGIIHAKKGSQSQAKDMIRQLEEIQEPYDFGWTPYYQARIFAHLDQEDKAFDLLEESVRRGAKFYANNVFDQDPDLQGLTSNPRFQSIIHPLEN